VLDLRGTDAQFFYSTASKDTMVHATPRVSYGSEMHNNISNVDSNDAINGSGVTFEIPVLIVGGGPTGLLLAHLLSKLRGKSKALPEGTDVH